MYAVITADTRTFIFNLVLCSGNRLICRFLVCVTILMFIYVCKLSRASHSISLKPHSLFNQISKGIFEIAVPHPNEPHLSPDFCNRSDKYE